MADKQPTQAIPTDGRKGAFDGTNQPGAAMGRGEGGESGGGAYPNPHTGKSAEKGKGKGKGEGGFGPHGGQSTMGYHGKGQLGADEVEGEGNSNAASRSD